jgi:hypothetical protein
MNASLLNLPIKEYSSREGVGGNGPHQKGCHLLNQEGLFRHASTGSINAWPLDLPIKEYSSREGVGGNGPHQKGCHLLNQEGLFRNASAGSMNASLLDLPKGLTFRGGAGQEQALHKKTFLSREGVGGNGPHQKE